MSEQEMLNKIKELEKRNKFLESVIARGSSGNTSAYNAIRLMIVEKVQKEVEQPQGLEEWQNNDTRQKAERKIMSDLKWDLRVRNISDFRSEHIQKAKEYIANYILPEELKKSRWVGV